MIDAWDGIGAAGVALVSAGVWRLAGWPWSAMFLGCVLMLLYMVREGRLASRLIGGSK